MQGKKKAPSNIHVSLAGRNEQRQHYLAGKWMSRQHSLWVGEEMSRDSDMCWLFMGVSEERVGEKKRRGWTRGKEKKRHEMG